MTLRRLAQEQEADTIAALRAKGEHATKAPADHMASAIQNRLNLYTEEIAKLKDQEEQYTKYGKLLDKSAVSVELAAISAGKYSKATYEQKGRAVGPGC